MSLWRHVQRSHWDLVWEGIMEIDRGGSGAIWTQYHCAAVEPLKSKVVLPCIAFEWRAPQDILLNQVNSMRKYSELHQENYLGPSHQPHQHSSRLTMLLDEHGANGRQVGANESLLSSQRIMEQLAGTAGMGDWWPTLTHLVDWKDHRWKMAWAAPIMLSCSTLRCFSFVNRSMLSKIKSSRYLCTVMCIFARISMYY